MKQFIKRIIDLTPNWTFELKPSLFTSVLPFWGIGEYILIFTHKMFNISRQFNSDWIPIPFDPAKLNYHVTRKWASIERTNEKHFTIESHNFCSIALFYQKALIKLNYAYRNKKIKEPREKRDVHELMGRRDTMGYNIIPHTRYLTQ